MACNDCQESLFKQKIGRCKSCMLQLTFLSLVGWPLWWWLYADDMSSVESIAMMFFCGAFSGLLCVHLMVLAYRKVNNTAE
ncbi:DUF3624 domain-containing protein [Shewanella goraebulensis]|uniref:DUF3624 domain-containing protein n=1 Tax=Shewanella goraebulensis TaxID=3050637 RepID=UPI002549D2C7|nr:DUF3624 domain-containing protein [Shewanella goraebulensis]